MVRSLEDLGRTASSQMETGKRAWWINPTGSMVIKPFHDKILSSIWGDDDEPTQQQLRNRAIRKLSDEDLLSSYATAMWNPTGEGDGLFANKAKWLGKEAQKRGLDLGSVETDQSWHEVFTNLRTLAKGTAGNYKGMLQNLRATEAAYASYRREQQQQEFIEDMKGRIADWEDDPRMDSLRDMIDQMKQNPGFSEQYLDDWRARINSQVRTAEAERLQRTNRILGIRGKRGQGSGAAAMLAHETAAEADALLQSEFGKIRTAAEQERIQRENNILSQEMRLTAFDVQQENVLSQMLFAAQQGQDVDPAAALGGLSEYLMAMENAAIAQSEAREARKTQLIGAGIGAAGELVGAYFTGGLSLAATQGKGVSNFLAALQGDQEEYDRMYGSGNF